MKKKKVEFELKVIFILGVLAGMAFLLDEPILNFFQSVQSQASSYFFGLFSNSILLITLLLAVTSI